MVFNIQIYPNLRQPKMGKLTQVHIKKNKCKYKNLRKQKVKSFVDDNGNKEIYVQIQQLNLQNRCNACLKKSTIKTPGPRSDVFIVLMSSS